jgi:hypothetical protein
VIAVEAGGGDLDGFDDGRGGDASFVHGGGGGDDGEDLSGIARVGWGGGLDCCDFEREDLFDGEILRGENAVQAFEGEGAFAIEEIRDMRLLKASLQGEAAASEGAAFDAPEEFETEKFMQVLKVHRFWKIESRGVPMANHIIRQDEDKANSLLYAIRFRGQRVDRWLF